MERPIRTGNSSTWRNPKYMANVAVEMSSLTECKISPAPAMHATDSCVSRATQITNSVCASLWVRFRRWGLIDCSEEINVGTVYCHGLWQRCGAMELGRRSRGSSSYQADPSDLWWAVFTLHASHSLKTLAFYMCDLWECICCSKLEASSQSTKYTENTTNLDVNFVMCFLLPAWCEDLQNASVGLVIEEYMKLIYWTLKLNAFKMNCI